MIKHDEWLIVGLITSPHGINGKIHVKSLSDFEERFTKPGKRWIQKENEMPRELELISGFKKPGKESYIIKLKGVDNRNPLLIEEYHDWLSELVGDYIHNCTITRNPAIIHYID